MTEETEKDARCMFAGCSRPRALGAPLRICELHTALWTAGDRQLQWEAAREMLAGMIKTAEAIGNASLVEVLEEASDRVECEIIHWETETKRLEDEL